MNVHDNPEKSMVQKHLRHIKTNREHLASEMLTSLTPEFGSLLRQFTLAESEFKIDSALEFMNEFKEIYPYKIKAFSVNRNMYMNNIQKDHLDRLLSKKEKQSMNQFINSRTKSPSKNIGKYTSDPFKIRKKSNLILSANPEKKSRHKNRSSRVIIDKKCKSSKRKTNNSSIRSPEYKESINFEHQSIAHDEEIRKSEISIRKQKEAEDRFRAVYAELKYSDKANEMRQQEMLKQRLSLAFRTGDKRTTEILLDRLRSNDDPNKLLRKRQDFV